MSELLVKKISFKSFLKLSIISNISFGFALGLIIFIISLFGGDVYADLVFFHFTGITAGIIDIFLAPVILGLFGIILGILAYVPFLLALIFSRGLTIKGLFEAPVSVLPEPQTSVFSQPGE